jgi:hypothetical protein
MKTILITAALIGALSSPAAAFDHSFQQQQFQELQIRQQLLELRQRQQEACNMEWRDYYWNRSHGNYVSVTPNC